MANTLGAVAKSICGSCTRLRKALAAKGTLVVDDDMGFTDLVALVEKYDGSPQRPVLPRDFGYSITSMSRMFCDCIAMESLSFPGAGDESDYRLDKVTDMSYLFSGCHALVSVAFPRGAGASVTNVVGMFEDCPKLNNLEFPSGFGARVAEDRMLNSVFEGCTGMTWVMNAPSFRYSYSMSDCPLLKGAVLNLFNGLPDVSAEGRETKPVLTLASSSVKNLTNYELTIATGKGWGLSTV